MYQIVDNFFEDPYEVRQIGLNLLAEKHSCILNDFGGNYPGIRCLCPNYIHEFILNFLKKTYDLKIKWFICCFHLTSSIHKLGLIHTDDEQYSGLIYLNENPKEHSGTILCNPIADVNTVECNDPLYAGSSTNDIKTIKEFIDYKEQFNKNFQIELEIENKFNRFIFYEGASHYHAPYYYFGNNLFNSRLVLVFWFYLM